MPKAGYVLNLKSPDFGLYFLFHLLNFFAMLKACLIGNLGADAQVKAANGREFVTFRVAHSWDFTSQDGTVNSGTIWVDCIGNNLKGVVAYLKKGTQVYVEGDISLRVYSSKQDRCMKAGLTIHVQSVQLIGGKTDDVPREVINPDTGDLYGVEKLYQVLDGDTIQMTENTKEMVDERGRKYLMDRNGYIRPISNNTQG